MKNDNIKEAFKSEPIKEVNGKYFFIESQEDLTSDVLDIMKSKLKQFGRFYYTAIDILAPVYSRWSVLSKHYHKKEGLKANLGSGNSNIFKDIINLDFIPYENVHIVADIHQLPFKDNSVDVFVNTAVLEHVKNPKIVLNEIYRCLKPDGIIISVVPFMQPFHASPHDYQRYTIPGLIELHKQFRLVESGVFSGLFSGFLWVFQELLATIPSFGSNKLRSI